MIRILTAYTEEVVDTEAGCTAIWPPRWWTVSREARPIFSAILGEKYVLCWTAGENW
ncbi:MAG: hypothetical protein LBD93_10340 [Treponema sp.]|jgi:hypothetical protein|nr:hypothetical protein [Treponema sp.]